jgi:transposase
MSKTLSPDLRVRVLAAARAGASHREAGERFGVSAEWKGGSIKAGNKHHKVTGASRAL